MQTKETMNSNNLFEMKHASDFHPIQIKAGTALKRENLIKEIKEYS